MNGDKSSFSSIWPFMIDLDFDFGEGVTLFINELTLSGEPAKFSIMSLKWFLAIFKGESRFLPFPDAGSI